MKWFHNHIWYTVHSSRFGKVQKCLECPAYQTTMLDYATNKIVAIPGNLLSAALDNKVFILCGIEEFQQAQRVLIGSQTGLTAENVIHLTRMEQLKEISMPSIFLWGSWYENEICQSPAFARILNGWI